ncbi:MAG: T9SS type A sorting domain-containing protein [Bacteroidia bacterium]|nr:T9SS type A sorting domain-containing protein [Bacteroidia bacterium]
MPLSKDFRKFITPIIFFLLTSSVLAQISYGGQPLPLNVSTKARSVSSSQIPFIEMPSFDTQQAMTRSETERTKFKSLEFAHKFHVFLRPDNSGITFTTSDNMKVWRVGIRSKNAFSLNILFSKFRLPERAKVFVYNADQSEILGSYTQENNTDLNLLPVQPIAGDEIIVEYQEPLNAAFKGEIEIGEVNHDFWGIFRATEPRDPEQSCHPNIVCYPEDIQAGSGVVALIINGTTYCTGSLVNNSSNNGIPYLLTATHCLNDNYCSSFLNNKKYGLVAGRIVAFFGYQSPVCDKEIRGITQMTIASTDSILIMEDYDISLLRFKQNPPKEYQAFYPGWNLSSSPQAPFHGIHHPNGGIKKIAIENDDIRGMATFTVTNNKCGNSVKLNDAAHWSLEAWDIGATEGGSSGSPLLDKNKRIIGTLTGGSSYCSSPKGPDQYAALYKAWNVTGSLGNPNSLKNYLDPENSQFQQIDGFNPYASQPYTKSSNYLPTDSAIQSYHNSVPMFATNNTLGYTEFAEEFQTSKPTKLEGVFVTSSSTNNISNMNIRIKIYADNNGSPGTILHEVPFNYSFRYYQSANFFETRRNMNYNVENYVKFSVPVEVSGKFFISYSDANNASSGFSLLNVQPRKIGSGIASTAWMKNATGWIKASENIENPINTSLLIAPYVTDTGLSAPINPGEDKTEIKAYYNNSVNRIFIESNKDLMSWEIFYILGQKVFEGKAKSSINRTSFSVDHLAKGIYVVKVSTNNKTEKIKVLVK